MSGSVSGCMKVIGGGQWRYPAAQLEKSIGSADSEQK
jgi:hypothetical protein